MPNQVVLEQVVEYAANRKQAGGGYDPEKSFVLSPGGIKIKHTVPFDQIEEAVKQLRALKKKHVREEEMAAKAAKELEAQAAEEVERQEAAGVIDEDE